MAVQRVPISAVLLVLVFHLPTPGVTAQMRPPASDPGGALPFELVANHLVLVNGSIGAFDDVNLIVDTGTARTVIDERLAVALESPRLEDSFEVFGSRFKGESLVVPTLSVGPIGIRGLHVLVADLQPQQQRLGRRIDALLGTDVLRERCLTIDYRSQYVDFTCRRSWSRKASFTPPLPVVDVSIDGHPYRLIADSGSEIIAIFRTSMPTGHHVKADGAASAAHLTGTTDLVRFTPTTLLVGGHSIRTPPVFVMPGTERIEGYDGVLGTRWLTAAQLHFDMRTGVLTWTP